MIARLFNHAGGAGWVSAAVPCSSAAAQALERGRALRTEEALRGLLPRRSLDGRTVNFQQLDDEPARQIVSVAATAERAAADVGTAGHIDHG